jgi:hypothetical protein
VVGDLEHELGHGPGRIDVAAVAVDLLRVGEGDGLQRALGVVEQRPRRPAAPRQADLGRIDVEVPQAAGGEIELVAIGVVRNRPWSQLQMFTRAR